MSQYLLGSTAAAALMGDHNVVAASFADLGSVEPVAGWGTILRNPDYTGPALEITDLDSTATQTIGFNANGFVTDFPAFLRYGVTKLYDQWGTEHLTISKNQGVYLTYPLGYKCAWLASPTGYKGGNMFVSPSYTDTVPAPAWKVAEPVWAGMFRRTVDTNNLEGIWGVESPTNFMEMGLWLEGHDFHLRINGSNPDDIPGTNWSGDAADVQNKQMTLISDMSQGDGAGHIYANGGLKLNKSDITLPLDFTSHYPLRLFGGWLGNSWLNGRMTELHIFKKRGAGGMTSGDRAYINSKLQAITFLTSEIYARQQRLFAILGAKGAVQARQQRLYAIKGRAKSDRMVAPQQRLYAPVITGKKRSLWMEPSFESGGYSGRTVRSFYPASHVNNAGEHVQLQLSAWTSGKQMSMTECFIGRSTGAGSYVWNEAPTRITFGGANGFAAVAGQVLSDVVPFHFDPADGLPLMIAYFLSSAISTSYDDFAANDRNENPTIGRVTYYKSTGTTSDAENMAPSGYSNFARHSFALTALYLTP